MGILIAILLFGLSFCIYMIKYMSCIRHLGEGYCEEYMSEGMMSDQVALVADIGEKFIYEVWLLLRIVNLEYIQEGG